MNSLNSERERGSAIVRGGNAGSDRMYDAEQAQRTFASAVPVPKGDSDKKSQGFRKTRSGHQQAGEVRIVP
jgi:hypothetical protein